MGIGAEESDGEVEGEGGEGAKQEEEEVLGDERLGGEDGGCGEARSFDTGPGEVDIEE